MIHGGGQERRLRSGTENVPGIVGLGEALELAVAAVPAEAPRQRPCATGSSTASWRPSTRSPCSGDREGRLPGNACFTIRYIEGESMVLKLDAMGIAVSSGSACASTSLEPSHVIIAMGFDPVAAHGSLRLTLGRENTGEDVDYFLEVFPGAGRASCAP